MMNKPVAWMQTWQNQDGELKQTVNIEQIGKQDIPLYTHPVKEQDIKYDVTIKWDDKTTHHEDVSGDTPLHHTNPAELTDEEIMDYVEAFSIDMGNVYEFQPDNVLQMIRAILDKAQEK